MVSRLYYTMFQKDRQCLYNVILRRVRVTIVTVERQQVGLLHIQSVSVAIVTQYTKRMRGLYCHL
jgi:hypothetical protein